MESEELVLVNVRRSSKHSIKMVMAGWHIQTFAVWSFQQIICL